ncbi:SDR family NAD(P)-dependent oxidoreductase [Chryseobacterium balustinum]|uniref:SDR family NAD(P)-dependent oxidoreductase n=1 Tax=Chryseobacterium balustinum TaxID=246 RepID=UPI003CEB5B6B
MIQNKTIIITGASSGIGREIAIHLSKLGANCVLIGRNQERLAKVKAECISPSLVISTDLYNFENYEEIVQKVFEEFGSIYGFVHSAGIEQTLLLPQIKIENLNEIFNINVFSAIEFIKIISKKKYKFEKQSFVVLSSVMGVVGNKGLTSYSATKGAIISMVRSMALELSSKKIRVNAVSPGHVSDSEMSQNKERYLSEEAVSVIEKNHPLGLGKCLDVAKITAFLLSEDSDWITGQNIVVDGGYSIQ